MHICICMYMQDTIICRYINRCMYIYTYIHIQVDEKRRRNAWME